MSYYHFFNIDSENFLYFIYSGKLYQIDENAKILISRNQNDNINSEKKVLERLPKLALNSSIHNELYRILKAEFDYVVQLNLDQFKTNFIQETNYRDFTIYIAGTCNFNCQYCWNNRGSFGNDKRIMSSEVAYKVVQFISNRMECSKTVNFSVKFFGGEPLLNFEVLKIITLGLKDTGKKLRKNVDFYVDTNGFLLENEISYFLAENFTEVGVSLDGNKNTHDLQRRHVSNVGTWDVIVKNISRFPAPEKIGIRATLLPTSESYLNTFLAISKLNIRNISIEYAKLCIYCKPGLSTVNVKQQSKEKIEFINWYIPYLRKFESLSEVPSLSSILKSISNLDENTGYIKPCRAGETLLSFDCKGDIYPCMAMIGMHKYKMGTVNNNEPITQHIFFKSVNDLDPCKNCWARLECTGGCLASNIEYNNNIYDPPESECELTKANTEVYLYGLAKLKENCSWMLNRKEKVYEPK